MNNLSNKLIVANWKMHKTRDESVKFIEEFSAEARKKKEFAKKTNSIAVICVPFTNIDAAVKAVKCNKPANLLIGAQNCYFEYEGAFTGEISAHMLKEIGAEYVILGHSERRNLFGETDEIINKKVISCLNEGLNVILCVGENLEQKNSGTTNKIISEQLKKGLAGVNKERLLSSLILAYEPIWAIGSQKSASSLEISEITENIKKHVAKLYNSEDIIPGLKVLYGGSVNSKNAAELLKIPSLGGVLVGGASLDCGEFLKILNCV